MTHFIVKAVEASGVSISRRIICLVPWRDSSLVDEKWTAPDAPVVTLQSCVQTNAFRVFPRMPQPLYKYFDRPVRAPGNTHGSSGIRSHDPYICPEDLKKITKVVRLVGLRADIRGWFRGPP